MTLHGLLRKLSQFRKGNLTLRTIGILNQGAMSAEMQSEPIHDHPTFPEHGGMAGPYQPKEDAVFRLHRCY